MLTRSSRPAYYAPTQVGGLGKADAFIVVKQGYIVQESYWGHTTVGTMHEINSGTKSVGSIAIAYGCYPPPNINTQTRVQVRFSLACFHTPTLTRVRTRATVSAAATRRVGMLFTRAISTTTRR